MPGCRVRVGTVMTWSAAQASSALLQIRVAEAPDQRLLDETLVAEGVRVEEGPTGPLGARPVRIHADEGPIAVRYAAGVEVDGQARICSRDDVPLPDAGELAFDLLPWTLPSRYCPSDALGPTAEATFGDMPRTRSLIPGVADWVRERISYQPGASDHLTTADQTLLAREGVCRDMAHLAVSFLRALEIPARVAAAYGPAARPTGLPRPARGPRRHGLAPHRRHGPGAGGVAGAHRHRTGRGRRGLGERKRGPGAERRTRHRDPRALVAARPSGQTSLTGA